MESLKAKKVFIYGVGGSGKTTLAKQLSQVSGTSWHSVDDLAFEANWEEVPIELQRQKIAAICNQPEWILDAAYMAWIDIPMARADLIIALDYPLHVPLTRMFCRSIGNLIWKRPLCNGNFEHFGHLFSKNSILLATLRSHPRKRKRIRSWINQSDGPQVICFQRPKETKLWLQGFQQTAESRI